MSFFDTEEVHAVMLAYAADRGPVDHRSSGPGSSGKSRFKAPAQFGAKKISISLNRSTSSRIDAHHCFVQRKHDPIQSFLHSPPVAHGGVSQRSCLPQQVVPGARPLSAKVNAETESIFSSSVLPHCLHARISSSGCPVTSISDISPQRLHLYS